MSANDPAACSLADRSCVPCRGGVPPLAGEELERYQRELGNGWDVIDGHHLTKRFRFRDFRSALDFTVQIGELAEEIGHHPDIQLAWGKVVVTVWTHKIDGLADADFIFAAKVDRLPGGG